MFVRSQPSPYTSNVYANVKESTTSFVFCINYLNIMYNTNDIVLFLFKSTFNYFIRAFLIRVICRRECLMSKHWTNLQNNPSGYTVLMYASESYFLVTKYFSILYYINVIVHVFWLKSTSNYERKR